MATEPTYHAERIGSLTIPLGTTVRLESLRQAVVPPYLMLLPFIEVPEGISVEAQYALPGEGVHGCTYILRAEAHSEGNLIIGFKDMRTQQITHCKSIEVNTTRPDAGASRSAAQPDFEREQTD